MRGLNLRMLGGYGDESKGLSVPWNAPRGRVALAALAALAALVSAKLLVRVEIEHLERHG